MNNNQPPSIGGEDVHCNGAAAPPHDWLGAPAAAVAAANNSVVIAATKNNDTTRKSYRGRRKKKNNSNNNSNSNCKVQKFGRGTIVIDSNSAAIKPSNGGRKHKPDWFPDTGGMGHMGDYFASDSRGCRDEEFSSEEVSSGGFGSGGFDISGNRSGYGNSISSNNILTASTVHNSPPRENKGKKSIPLPQSNKNTQKRKGSIYASPKEVIQEMLLTRKNNAHALKVLGKEVSQLNIIQQQCKKYIEGAAQNATDEDTFDEFGLLWNNETGKEMENRLKGSGVKANLGGPVGDNVLLNLGHYGTKLCAKKVPDILDEDGIVVGYGHEGVLWNTSRPTNGCVNEAQSGLVDRFRRNILKQVGDKGYIPKVDINSVFVDVTPYTCTVPPRGLKWEERQAHLEKQKVETNALLGAEQIDLDLLTACIISRHATSHRLRNDKALVVQPFTPFAAKVFRCSKHSQSNPQPTTTKTINLRQTTVHMEFSFYQSYWENFSPDHVRRLDEIMFKTYQIVGVFDDVDQDALQKVLPTVYYELSTNKEESTLNKLFKERTWSHGEEPVSTSCVSTPELKEFVMRWYEDMVPWFKKQYGIDLPPMADVTIYQANCYYGHLSGKKSKREGTGVHDENNPKLKAEGVSNWGQYGVKKKTGVHDENNPKLKAEGVSNWGQHGVKKKTGIHDEIRMQKIYVEKCKDLGYYNADGSEPSPKEAKRCYVENKAYDKHLPKIQSYVSDESNYETLDDGEKVFVVPAGGEHKQTYNYLSNLRRADNDDWRLKLLRDAGMNMDRYEEAGEKRKRDFVQGKDEAAKKARSDNGFEDDEDSDEDSDDNI